MFEESIFPGDDPIEGVLSTCPVTTTALERVHMSPRFRRILIALLVCVALPGGPQAFGQAAEETWAGSYSTAVSLTPGQNTCGDVTVQDNVTTVKHDPATHNLWITHVGNTYEGSVDDSGYFTTKPRTLSGGGSEFTVSITGHFIKSGFEATVTVKVKQSKYPPTCSYNVGWKGKRKSG
jgi:hypothetical protein